jgi:NAD(P)-dependent dehydrogenase (short-subunit alcohol dehydrogenase family)
MRPAITDFQHGKPDMTKTWMITGANRGLGLEMARAVLGAGHNVVATARKPEAIEAALGASSNLLAVKLDVTQPDQAEAAVAAAKERFGRIDVLVNNAGYGQLGWFENTSDEQIGSSSKPTCSGPCM